MDITTFERTLIAPIIARAPLMDTYYKDDILPAERRFDSTTRIFLGSPPDNNDGDQGPTILMSRTSIIPDMKLHRDGNLKIPGATQQDDWTIKGYPKAYKCRIYFYANSFNVNDQRKLQDIILTAYPSGGQLSEVDDAAAVVPDGEKLWCSPYTNVTSPISKAKEIEDIYIYDISELYLTDPIAPETTAKPLLTIEETYDTTTL